jgi:diguanylate cyclase (GGDEF)-like protein
MSFTDSDNLGAVTVTGSLIGRVADTTAHRDRDALDVSVVHLLQDFLDGCSVGLFRLIDEGKGTRLARRAFTTRGSMQAAVDTAGDATHDLPPLASEASWRQCIGLGERVQSVHDSGRHLCLFPVEEKGIPSGVLEVLTDSPISAREARLVGGVLRILRNQLALLDYGERDTLTGLLNRKTFETRIHRLTAGLRDIHSGPAVPGTSWLGLLDIDHFKHLNDRYGHLFGDEVLLLVSQIMKQTFRGADELFRFGGEEFVIVLAQADPQGARIAFERLRAAIDTHTFPQSARVTVSLGYTRIISRDVPTLCVERADAALYYAKNHGRNNVRNHEDLVAEGKLSGQQKEGEVELF